LEGRSVDDSNSPTYSISFRLQRTTTEFAFVSVPVTVDDMIEQPDGTGRLDVSQMVQRAIDMGDAFGVHWHQPGD
jgi:hypothetical protein